MSEPENRVELLRRLRATDQPIAYGQAPTVNIQKTPPTGLGIGLFITVAIITFIGSLAFNNGFLLSANRAIAWGVLAACIYWLFPVLVILYSIVRYRALPDITILDDFSSGQKSITCLALSFGLTLATDVALLKIFHWWHSTHPHFHYLVHSSVFVGGFRGIFSLSQFLGIWLIFLVLTAFLGMCLFFRYPCPTSGNSKKMKKPQENQKTEEATERSEIAFTPSFKLWIGESTGWLASRSHTAGIAPNQQITLALEDACQNILILGGIGSGKTTRAIHPLLIQLLDQNCGGLIFDIKGDFQKAVLVIAENTNNDNVTVIGPTYFPMNLLAGLTPEIAASFLKSVFMLSGGHRNETFWIDTATELCRNTLGVLSFIPEHYSLHGLYNYLFDTETRIAIDDEVKKILPSLDKKVSRLLSSYWQYQEKVFDQFDEKVKAGVNATIAQVLAPFNHPDLIDAFCSTSENNVPIEDVLNGAVYLVALPLAVWGLGGKVVYTLIKLRFFNVMQLRTSQQMEMTEETKEAENEDTKKPVFFMCDEFQEIVSANRDGLSDLNFWDKSRSSKTIGIISAQAISSFYAAIGDRDVANALLQNFRQKICFKTEDVTTLQYFNSLADKVEITRKTFSKTDGETRNNFSISNSSHSSSNAENLVLVDKPVLDAQLFRELKPEQALALISFNGHSIDDVLNVMPVYID